MDSKRHLSESPLPDFLHEARIPLRIACNTVSGHPLLASLWFAPIGSQLWCATQANAAIAQRLAADSRCAIEVSGEAMPYRGVRGRGSATLHPDRGREVLEVLIERYLGDERADFARWLRARADREVAIAISPEKLLSWDYSQRMSGDT